MVFYIILFLALEPGRLWSLGYVASGYFTIQYCLWYAVLA
jgi:hypothetical protein